MNLMFLLHLLLLPYMAISESFSKGKDFDFLMGDDCSKLALYLCRELSEKREMVLSGEGRTLLISRRVSAFDFYGCISRLKKNVSFTYDLDNEKMMTPVLLNSCLQKPQNNGQNSNWNFSGITMFFALLIGKQFLQLF